MTHDVPQWLAEIQSLRQQMAEARRERESAYASAANWRQLYETEAQQRRTEAALTNQQMEALHLELQHLRGGAAIAPDHPDQLAWIRSEVESLQTVAELRDRLIAVMLERDRLLQTLQIEQENHAETRKTLTLALGDAIDLLSKEEKKMAEDSQV